MSGTLGGEGQKSSDRLTDLGCRQRAREGRTDPMGHPLALPKALTALRCPPPVASV